MHLHEIIEHTGPRASTESVTEMGERLLGTHKSHHESKGKHREVKSNEKESKIDEQSHNTAWRIARALVLGKCRQVWSSPSWA